MELPTLEPGGAGAKAHAYNEQWDPPKFPCHWNNPDVRGALYAFQGHVCAYCGTRLPRNDRGDVDHFRPKSKYWWLAYALSNYMMSCSRCNRELKRSKFPLRRGASPVTYEQRAKLRREAHLLLEPTVDTIEALITLHDMRLGWLSPSLGIQRVEYTKVQGTIEFFRLNLDVPLVRERLAVVDAVLDALEQGALDKAQRLAIRFRPHSLVARAMLLELGHSLPSVHQELSWQVDDLVRCPDEVMEALVYAPYDEINRSAQQELLWSLAVLAKFPLGLPSEFVFELLRAHEVAEAVRPYFEQL
ncbi:MAG: HNH endonuclease [Myxococcota bacterium]